MINIQFRNYKEQDLECMKNMWNEILEDGTAFPGTVLYENNSFHTMLSEQTAVVCMEVDGIMAGYYILHPNNIGRCSHIANASYVLSKHMRGKHLGKYLVMHSIQEAKKQGFRGLQFNAVVASNLPALHIYAQAGFQKIGTIPNGFLLKNGTYSDMHILYLSLADTANNPEI